MTPTDKRAVLVTGASRGIGRAIAIRLAADGWDVGLNFVSNREGAEETAAAVREQGGRAALVPGDVASGEARTGLLAAFDAAFGRIDALVNNAGVSAARRTDLLEMTEESFERVLGVNLRGPHFLCRDVARRMLAERRRRPADPLHMVNISSISEYAVSVYRGEYCIAKAGLGMVTQLYAQRLAAAGIQVNEIRPGIIATDMTAAVREKYDRLIAAGLTPMPRWGTPEDVAAAVAALLGGSFPFTTGAAFDVDGGFRIRSL